MVTVGAKSLALLPMTVLESGAEFRARTRRDVLSPGPWPSGMHVHACRLGRGTVAGEGNDVHGPPALSPTVHRACENGAGGVVVRAPRMRAWCGETALLAIRAAE